MPSGVRTGTVLAGFRVESLIGQGAMGTVYLAEDAARGRRVALKLLAPELGRDERFRRRFLRESQLAASLDHPHIVPTFAAGEEDGVLYLAMAYVEGADLRQLLRREGRLEPERTLDLVVQVAEALDAAHTAGLVHRDVKPGNILVATEPEGERAYVCDFGLARHVSSVSSLTGERGFVGTIDYVPPEQIEGGPIDGRADVYSLGCVLYECLAGERPFDRESELSVVFAHLNEPPPRLSDLRPELPEAFDAVFANALAKSPNDRYSTCGELVEAARAALQGKVVARRKVRRRRALLAAVAVLAAAGAALIGVLVSRGSADQKPKPQTLSLRPNALNLIDARTQRVAGRIAIGTQVPIGDTGWDVAFSERSAWLLLFSKRRVVRIDLATHQVTGLIKLPWNPGRIASGGGSVWLTQDFGHDVLRIDPRTAKIAGHVPIRGGVSEGGLAYGDGSLWVAGGPGVIRIDPRNGRALHRFPLEGTSAATRLVFADGAVWAARPGNGAIEKIDPVENRVTEKTRLRAWVSDLSVGGGFVWVSIIPDGVVYQLSEDDLSVRGNPSTGPDPERISFGGGKLWIANTRAGTVSLLDPGSGVRRPLRAGADPATVLYRDGLVWAGAAPSLPPLPPIAGQELRVSTPTDPGWLQPDPISRGSLADQSQYATCANLLNYPDSAGPDGARLRPEIAAAMPTLSRDGRTYTFRIRPGFRFSPPSNEAVTAGTFRHTIERALWAKNQWSSAPAFASDIVGISDYRAGKAAHISGLAVRGATLSITLVRPAGDFLTRISMLAFCPVPLSQPLHQSGRPIPSAGPYYISSTEGDRTVLLRNPNYAGNRPRRSERVVYTNDLPTQQAIPLVDRGAMDLLPTDFDNTTSLLNPGGVLDKRYGAASAAARAGRERFFLYDAPFLDYIVFNTRRPLFRDVRLRRAVNYALDRPALAAAFADAPADGIVPPTVPAHPTGRFYPIGGPDLATARRLAGGRSRRAVLYWCGSDIRQRKLAEIVRSNLARIRMTVAIAESRDCPGSYRAADLFFGFVGNDERDPAPFLDQALATGVYGSPLGPGPWNDETFRKRLERARPLRGEARVGAYARLEKELTRAAPFASFGSWVWSQYFSPKVGCKLFQAEYHVVDLGALCKD